jgi:hypothetical protein
MVFIYFSRGKIHDMKELDAFLPLPGDVCDEMDGWMIGWWLVGFALFAPFYVKYGTWYCTD